MVAETGAAATSSPTMTVAAATTFDSRRRRPNAGVTVSLDILPSLQVGYPGRPTLPCVRHADVTLSRRKADAVASMHRLHHAASRVSCRERIRGEPSQHP